MSKTGSLEHFPDGGVAPVVRTCLRPDAEVEIVMAALQMTRRRPVLVPVKAYHILPKLLESLVEGLLVVFTFTLAIADQSASIADENEHTPLVNTIKRRHICDRITVKE